MKKRMDASEQKRLFDEWLDEHKGLFFKVVRAFAVRLEDRDDLFQEISVQIWHSIPNFRAESSVATWIYRVALYSAIAWTRSEKRHQDGKQPFIESKHTLIENAAPKGDRLDWLYDQIAQLNEIDRSLTLLLLDGYSYREMADILGISESNVGVKINRIKKQLVKKSQEPVNHGV